MLRPAAAAFVRGVSWCLLLLPTVVCPAIAQEDSPDALSVYPVVTPVTQTVSSGPFTAKFVVSNTYGFGMTVTPSCQAGTGLSCGSVTPSSFYSSGSGSQDTVSVQYSTGTPGGTRTLTLQRLSRRRDGAEPGVR